MRNIHRAKQDIEDVVFTEADGSATETLPVPQGDGSPAKPHRKWLPGLPHFQDESQKKAFGNILKFMALILIFTLIARGTAGATLAKVDTVAPYAGEIVVSVQATGTVQAASSHPIALPVGLAIQDVLVVQGQSVKAGNAILRLDTEEVAEGRGRAQIALDELNLNLQKLERGEAYDNSALVSAQNALAWAQQDYDTTKSAGEAATSAAQTALTDAENALVALRENEDAQSADIAAAEAAVNAARTALDDAAHSAETALQAAARAIETARVNLESAQKADAAARQDAADTAAQNALDAEAMRLDIEKQQAVLEAYDAIQDGAVLAGADGVVLEVPTAGTVTTAAAVVLISNASGGYMAQAEIGAKDAARLQSGAQVNVSAAQGYYAGGNPGMATLLSLSAPDGEDRVTVTVKLPDGEWAHGQAVNMEAVMSRQQYQSCVPLSALAQGQDGYFVYVMEQRSGVMGTENVVRRVPVTVLAQDASVAAIEGGVMAGERVISRTSKPLADGDKVRVRQP